MSKDLFTQAITQQEIGIASIHREEHGRGWFLYPNSEEPIQLVLLPGQKMFIEITVPKEGTAAFVRYYRGE